MREIRRSTFREIGSSFGRFMAIFAIIALGVGFFSGLKVAKEAMVTTVKGYLDEHAFYDLRLLSTLGFEEEDVEGFRGEADVECAEGSFSMDVLYRLEDGKQGAVKAYSLTSQVNTVKLVAGRLPESADECVVDSNMFGEDAVGTTLALSEENDQDTLDSFQSESYRIVGLVQSPLYIQYERGNTSLGTGRLSGFIYLMPEGFNLDVYTEVYVRFQQDNPLYGDAYQDYMDEKTPVWEELVSEAADRRFDELVGQYPPELAGIAAEQIGKPATYVLGRNTNIGYVCFESDSSIVEGIANIFPVFFFLVAALVCITTMNRMVEEQRTQIGVLKALGYGNGTIMSKYMIYSGLAAVLGCVSGFAMGTWGFPKVIWYGYGIMYKADPIVYVFDWRLAVVSLVVSLFCSVGTTWLSCRVELSQVAAQLMRPKAPKAGKRVFLEKIPFLWKHFSFLKKVSVRNIFRYKKRLFMMVLGISGCTALLVTGFGIRDSIAEVATQQYTEIQTYDLSISLRDVDDGFVQKLEDFSDDGLKEALSVMEKNMDLVTDEGVKSVYLVVGDPTQMPEYLDMHTEEGEAIAYPGTGEGVITHKLAGQYGIREGDTVTLRDENMNSLTVKISAVMENYIYNYVYVSEETWKDEFDGEPERKTVYVNLEQDTDAHELSAELMKVDGVSNVNVNRDMMDRVNSMMKSLDIIVLVVILCAAGLAFIVLYNLTNINITERVREIATIKVLGFYKNETASYCFRENILLAAMGMLVGLVLGRFLHAFVMSQIQVDLVAFDVRISALSYLYSALLTIVFAGLINLAMGGKLEKISMTESLKSVD